MDNLLDLNSNELTEYIKKFGHKPYRAKQLLKWIYHFGERDFSKMTDLAITFRESLKEIAKIGKGMFFRASNNESLKEIFEIIDTYEKVEIKESRYKETIDYYQYYLLWSMIFFITWMMVKNTFVNNSIID